MLTTKLSGKIVKSDPKKEDKKIAAKGITSKMEILNIGDMAPGFRSYLVDSGLSDDQIDALSPALLLSSRRDYEQWKQAVPAGTYLPLFSF